MRWRDRKLALIRLARGSFTRHGLVDQLGQADAPLDRLVIDEMELAPPGASADETVGCVKASRVLQSVIDEEIVAFAAQRRVENLRMRIVMAHFNAGQSEHADAWIFKLVTDQIRQLALDLVGDAQRAREIFWHNASTREAIALQAARDFDDFVRFHLIPDLDIVEVLSESPHSKPALTSRTSSLKRFRESSSPV